MIKVVKFGGSSVANAAQFEKVKNIVESDTSRKFIVTSACGKGGKEDHKITDLLYLCHAHLKYGVSYAEIFDLIRKKYYGIRNDLGLHTDLDGEFSKIEELMKMLEKIVFREVPVDIYSHYPHEPGVSHI